MPLAELKIRKFREILNLKLGQGRTDREVADAAGVSFSAIRACLKMFEASGLEWTEARLLDDDALERQVYQG